MLSLRFNAVTSFITSLSISFSICALLVCGRAHAAENIRVWLSNPQNVQPGTIMDLSVMMSSTQQLGGVDFSIHYNDSLLGFISVEQDTGLSDWEYFQTFHDDSLDIVRFLSIAETSPPASDPDSSELHPKGAIATLHFFVAPNWLADSGRVDFEFTWEKCGSNAASNTAGDSLIIVRKIYDSDGSLIWDETDDVNFPEIARPPLVGVPDSCIVPGAKVVSKIDVYSGFALNYYICGDFDRSASISIGDAVAAVNYIFGGGPAPNPLAAGDVDCSGAVSIGDAVYLINFIFGGGPPPCAGCE